MHLLARPEYMYEYTVTCGKDKFKLSGAFATVSDLFHALETKYGTTNGRIIHKGKYLSKENSQLPNTGANLILFLPPSYTQKPGVQTAEIPSACPSFLVTAAGASAAIPCAVNVKFGSKTFIVHFDPKVDTITNLKQTISVHTSISSFRAVHRGRIVTDDSAAIEISGTYIFFIAETDESWLRRELATLNDCLRHKRAVDHNERTLAVSAAERRCHELAETLLHLHLSPSAKAAGAD